MIKVSDLKRIRKVCFDKIAQCGVAKRDLAVRFTAINTELYEVVLSNGEDYARLVGDLTKMCALPDFQINWGDFVRVCDFFQDTIAITVKDKTILFSEGKTKYKCNYFSSNANEGVNFKFDFSSAFKINMDNLFIIKDFGNMGKFAISQSKLVSTDGNFCAINEISEDIGDDIQMFTTKFPIGTWFFNPQNRVIVSEDKRIACTVRRANGVYPFKGLIDLSNQVLNNWFECDLKEFYSAIERCSKIDDKIIMKLKDDHIVFKTVGAFGSFQTDVNVEFEHTSPKEEMRMAYHYLVEYCRCAKDGRIRIYFDDNKNEYKLKSVTDGLTIFGVGLLVPSDIK